MKKKKKYIYINLKINKLYWNFVCKEYNHNVYIYVYI